MRIFGVETDTTMNVIIISLILGIPVSLYFFPKITITIIIVFVLLILGIFGFFEESSSSSNSSSSSSSSDNSIVSFLEFGDKSYIKNGVYYKYNSRGGYWDKDKETSYHPITYRSLNKISR